MGNDKNNNHSQATAKTIELHQKLCELEKILSEPNIYEILQQTSARMDKKIFGKKIIDGWSDGLTVARNGISNLKVITAEVAEATVEGKK